jgi:hypothetical protein
MLPTGTPLNNFGMLKKAAASEEVRRTLRYVDPLSDARTPLADVFSILLDTTMQVR